MGTILRFRHSSKVPPISCAHLLTIAAEVVMLLRAQAVFDNESEGVEQDDAYIFSGILGGVSTDPDLSPSLRGNRTRHRDKENIDIRDNSSSNIEARFYDRDITASGFADHLYCLHPEERCSRMGCIEERIFYAYNTMDGCIKLLIIIILLGVIASML